MHVLQLEGNYISYQGDRLRSTVWAVRVLIAKTKHSTVVGKSRIGLQLRTSVSVSPFVCAATRSIPISIKKRVHRSMGLRYVSAALSRPSEMSSKTSKSWPSVRNGRGAFGGELLAGVGGGGWRGRAAQVARRASRQSHLCSETAPRMPLRKKSVRKLRAVHEDREAEAR